MDTRESIGKSGSKRLSGKNSTGVEEEDLEEFMLKKGVSAVRFGVTREN